MSERKQGGAIRGKCHREKQSRAETLIRVTGSVLIFDELSLWPPKMIELPYSSILVQGDTSGHGKGFVLRFVTRCCKDVY